jgi:epoxyqueuosine reductase
LGWIGKNGNIIHPKAGSFYFIATLITDLTLEYDKPLVNPTKPLMAANV